MSRAAALRGGFADPALQGAVAFRAILDAMARPGTIGRLAGAVPPAPLSPAAGAVLLTLADATTPLHLARGLDAPDLRAWVAFHTGAPLASAAGAALALGRWEGLLPLDRFPRGTPEYPDRSATLIVELDRLDPAGARLTGPGIDGTAHLSLPDAATLAARPGPFPLGIDIVFCAGDRIAALPRTTRVAAERAEAERAEAGRLEAGRLEAGRLEAGRLEAGRLEAG